MKYTYDFCGVEWNLPQKPVDIGLFVAISYINEWTDSKIDLDSRLNWIGRSRGVENSMKEVPTGYDYFIRETLIGNI